MAPRLGQERTVRQVLLSSEVRPFILVLRSLNLQFPHLLFDLPGDISDAIEFFVCQELIHGVLEGLEVDAAQGDRAGLLSGFAEADLLADLQAYT